MAPEVDSTQRLLIEYRPPGSPRKAHFQVLPYETLDLRSGRYVFTGPALPEFTAHPTFTDLRVRVSADSRHARYYYGFFTRDGAELTFLAVFYNGVRAVRPKAATDHSARTAIAPFQAATTIPSLP